MKKWLLLLIHAAEAFIVLTAVYFEPTYCVRGTLSGEAFFEGRPTSYWRSVIVRDLRQGLVIIGDLPPPRPNWRDRCMKWIGYEPEINRSSQLLDKAAAPVLREVAEDESPVVAGFARDVLDYPAPPANHRSSLPGFFFLDEFDSQAQSAAMAGAVKRIINLASRAA